MKKSFYIFTFLSLFFLHVSVDAKIKLIGDANSPVQILIYGSLQCPFTKKVLEYVPQFENEFGSHVSVVLAHFPLSFQRQSQPAAIAAECANNQGKGYPYIMELISQQARLSPNFFIETAISIGIESLEDFENCWLNKTPEEQIISLDRQTGVALGVDGVPYSFINGHIIDRALSYKEFTKIINQKLKVKEIDHEL